MKRYIYKFILYFVSLMYAFDVQATDITSTTWAGGTLSGTYVLKPSTGKIVTLSKSIIVASGKSLTIDLNGYMLKGGSFAGDMITVNGTLTIKDSSNKTIEHKGNLNGKGLWQPNNNGSIILKGGVLCPTYANESTNREGLNVSGTCIIEYANIVGCYSNGIGAAITMTSTGKLTMNAGSVQYNYTGGTNIDGDSRGGVIYGEPKNTNPGATINISNTNISNNISVEAGGGICGYNVTLTNCTIEHNTSSNKGGGINIRNSGSLTIDNSTIRYNAATNGGGIFCTGTTQISNSTYIQHNYAKITGGGIYSTGPTTITSSFILSNRAMSTETGVNANGGGQVNYGRGGGFNFSGKGKGNTPDENDAIVFTLDNTLVKDNAAMYYGGGGQISASAKLVIQNNTKINNNTAVLKGAGGLHITGDAYFYMNPTTELSYNTSCGVGGGIHSSYECHIHLNGGIISHNKVYGRGGGVHVNTGGDVVLKGTDITNNEAYKSYNMITSTVVLGNDGTYSWTEPQHDNTVALAYGGGLLINSGSCTMNSGELSSNYAETLGGGIALIMQEAGEYAHHVRLGIFTLNAGNVSQNSTDGNGGGIYLMRNIISELSDDEKKKYTQLVEGGDWTPKIILNGGVISENNADANGGAAYQEQNTSFIVSKDKSTIIKNNSSELSGGAVYISDGEYIINGTAEILGNESTEGNGGAIYLGGGTFTVNSGAKVTLGSQAAPNQALKGKGGAIYCAAPFTANGEISMQSNKANEGGAIYVDGGSLTANATTAKITASGNSAANGGVFCVNKGNVTLNSATMEKNQATNNGGAIALYDGTFSMTKESHINSNAATNFGGGLYVYSATANTEGISCTGGSFIGNTAKAGGAVFADGDFPLELAADMEHNKAAVGGAIYMANGVDMDFGAGIIRLNVAEGTTTEKTAYQKTHNDVSGVGGGIFMADNTTLVFSAPSQLGIYDNAATNAGADICANGNNTTVTLAAIDETNLAGKEGPGNDLYWVYDYFNDDTYQGLLAQGLTPMRYEDLLMKPSEDDEDLVQKYIVPDNKTTEKQLNGYVCLDLGYDLVFVHFKTAGLNAQDNTAILMSFLKDGAYVLYRKVLFNGVQERIVGLPSSTWKFEASNWGIHYDSPVFSVTGGSALTGGVTDVSNKNKNFTVTFTENDNAAMKKSLIHEHYKINRMIPK